MEYTFVRNCRDDETLRKSFSSLAKRTFGIDFEKWYESGGWNRNYIPYSFRWGDEIIANVSVNTMELVIRGKRHKAIQIGTVMTDPQHRRKGLAAGLMKRVMEDFGGSYDLFFLAADEEAVPLYERFGFRKIEAKRFVIDTKHYRRAEKPLQRENMSLETLLELKGKAVPVSEILSAVSDEHILAFYYVHGFSECIYKIEGDIYAIFEMEGDVIHLYDVLSTEEFSLENIIGIIAPMNIKSVECHFTPPLDTEGLHILEETEGGWMIRSEGETVFPEISVYPEISKA